MLFRKELNSLLAVRVLMSVGLLAQAIYGQQKNIPSGATPTVAPATHSTSSQPTLFQTTLITALGALIGVLLKDFIFKLLEEQRSQRRELAAIYSRYADPLASAAVTLMWRLHEAINQPGRGRFLKLVGVPDSTNKYSTFGAYKKLSTLYRVAALLGWIRACRREFSYLRVADGGGLKPIEDSIASIESALADGPAVETERARKLCELWQFSVPGDENRLSSIAVEIEAAMDDFMQKGNISEISDLDRDGAWGLVALAARALADGLEVPTPSDAVLNETTARAAQILGIKEAWIYRDWQAAIGDLMIRSVESAERRFEVIGFSEFESMYHDGTNDQKRWMERLSSVFDGIDMSKRDPYDYRRTQIFALLCPCATLTETLSERTQSTAISPDSVELARSLTRVKA